MEEWSINIDCHTRSHQCCCVDGQMINLNKNGKREKNKQIGQ